MVRLVRFEGPGPLEPCLTSRSTKMLRLFRFEGPGSLEPRPASFLFSISVPAPSALAPS